METAAWWEPGEICWTALSSSTILSKCQALASEPAAALAATTALPVTEMIQAMSISKDPAIGSRPESGTWYQRSPADKKPTNSSGAWDTNCVQNP